MSYYGYCRISTFKQDILKQENAIYNYCQQNQIVMKKMVGEQVSGTVKYTERNLGYLLDEMKKGDTLIITELSRLSRKTIEALNIVSDLLNRGINVTLVNNGITLKDDPMGKIYLTVFSLVSELERNSISERTKSALASVKASGTKLGRPRGNGKSKLDSHHDEIVELLRKGVSKASITKIYDCSITALNHWIKTRKIMEEI